MTEISGESVKEEIDTRKPGAEILCSRVCKRAQEGGHLLQKAAGKERGRNRKWIFHVSRSAASAAMSQTKRALHGCAREFC